MMLDSGGSRSSWSGSVTIMVSVVRRAACESAPQGSRRCNRMAPTTVTSKVPRSAGMS